MNYIGKLNAAVYRNLQKLLEIKLKDIDIRVGEYDFFYVIGQNQGWSQQELSQHIMVDKSTTARVIKDLEKKGMIEKKRDKVDSRIFRIYLTEYGREKKLVVDKIFKEVMDILGGEMKDEEIESLVNQLEIVLKNIIKEVQYEKEIMD